MASEDEVLALRQMIAEEGDDSTWTDEALSAIIDAEETLNGAAAKVWSVKAGRMASLVDVTESGSSRKLSDLRKGAQELAAYYSGLDVAEEVAVDGPVITRIRRTVA